MTRFEQLKALIAAPGAECIIWPGQIVDGYGYLKHGSRVPLRAHRVAWTEVNGPIPAGQVVCHRCDVRACINPIHLFLGTQAENLADMYAKGRQRCPGAINPLRGEDCPAAVLSAAQVQEILADNRSQRVVARAHAVSKSQVGRIRRGENWRHNQTIPE